MNKLFFTLLLVASINAESFISPINFKNTQENKNKVIAFIKFEVARNNQGMDIDEAVARYDEEMQLEAFKTLIHVENKGVLKSTIKNNCDEYGCSYGVILMAYQENIKAKNKVLSW
ncbi:MAG TPA: hypothetical protein EYG74_06540 [Sulfurimonas autotrophica]|nr:hypothetical protein [Sulfurimonas autotrophica]